MNMSVPELTEPTSTQEQKVPAEIVAAIAAVATALLGSQIRIRSIRSLSSRREQLSRWTQQGRVSVQASHNLKRKR